MQSVLVILVGGIVSSSQVMDTNQCYSVRNQMEAQGQQVQCLQVNNSIFTPTIPLNKVSRGDMYRHPTW